jgi:hypothetical protein
MESEEAPLAGLTLRSGGRLSLAAVFILAISFALLSTIPFVAFALAYGPNVAENIIQTDRADILWLLRSGELAFFLIFYQLGKRFDFRGQYLQLATLSFGGVLIGALPELVSVQTASATSSAVFGFAFEGVGLGNAISLFVSYLNSAFQDFAFPFAGFALAFVIEEGHLRPALWPSAASGERRLLSPPVLALGFGVTTMAYLASAIADVIGSRLTGQSAFPIPAFVDFAYGPYAYDFFYPLLFFVFFYFLGRRLGTIRGGMVAFAVSVFASGALGYLLGNPLAYYVRAFAAPLGQPFPPFSFGLSFFEEAGVRGFYVLVLGLAAATFGFVRNMEREVEPRPLGGDLGLRILRSFARFANLDVEHVALRTGPVHPPPRQYTLLEQMG